MSDYLVFNASLLGTKRPSTVESISDRFVDEGADLAFFTEIYTQARAKKLREKGYQPYFKRGTDTGVMVKRKRFNILFVETIRITNKYFFMGTGKRAAPEEALFLVVEDKETKERTLWVMNHFPSSVEGRKGKGGIFDTSTMRRVIAWLSQVHGIRKQSRILRKRFKVDAVAYIADWNMNIMRAEVRAWFKANFPAMKSNFRRGYKGMGTLGKRVIDFMLLSRRWRVIGHPEVRRTKASDHNYVRTVLHLVERRRKNR